MTFDAGIITTGHNKINDGSEYYYSTDYTLAPVYKNARYNFEVAIFYKYTDSYLEFAGNFNADGELNGVAQRYVEGYNILDLTISKYIYENRLCISGGIRNLFNVTFIDSNGNLNFHGSSGTSTAIGYGRTYFIKLAYTFEK
jgi:outer membrane receptor for ferrienterochelin and colicins